MNSLEYFFNIFSWGFCPSSKTLLSCKIKTFWRFFYPKDVAKLKKTLRTQGVAVPPCSLGQEEGFNEKFLFNMKETNVQKSKRIYMRMGEGIQRRMKHNSHRHYVPNQINKFSLSYLLMFELGLLLHNLWRIAREHEGIYMTV